MARIHHKATPQSAQENRARAQKAKHIDNSPSLLSRVWSQCRDSFKSPRIMKRTTQARPPPSQSRTKKVAFASGAIIIPPGPPPVPARAPTRTPAPAIPAQMSASLEVMPEAPRSRWSYPQDSTGVGYVLGVLDMTFIVQNLLGL